MIVLKKKFGLGLGQAPSAILLLVLVAITAVVGVKISTQLQTGEATTSSVYLAAENTTAGIQQLTSQMTLIGLIIAMAVVIGILFSSFGGLFGSSGGGV